MGCAVTWTRLCRLSDWTPDQGIASSWNPRMARQLLASPDVSTAIDTSESASVRSSAPESPH